MYLPKWLAGGGDGKGGAREGQGLQVTEYSRHGEHAAASG